MATSIKSKAAWNSKKNIWLIESGKLDAHKSEKSSQKGILPSSYIAAEKFTISDRQTAIFYCRVTLLLKLQRFLCLLAK